MEYSIYDALEAGFDKVVFVIKKSMADVFREMVENRIAKKVDVCYAFQEYDSLRSNFMPPQDRTKPYGTVHAVLCTKGLIHEPFAVINADDYYGKGAFTAMRNSLYKLPPKGYASMVGYQLQNTVSENGFVTRGVCEVDDHGKLKAVTETYRIALLQDGTVRDMENDVLLNPQSLVSMNFWGFTPWIFDVGEVYMDAFLMKLAPDEMKKEYPLPIMVDSMMRSGVLTVDVLSTEAKWFGVTYQEDKPYVVDALRKLHDTGAYPETLFES
jgi:dTDP-glucose pyrophosphorylase